jgi:hypothetical protein
MKAWTVSQPISSETALRTVFYVYIKLLSLMVPVFTRRAFVLLLFILDFLKSKDCITVQTEMKPIPQLSDLHSTKFDQSLFTITDTDGAERLMHYGLFKALHAS